MSNLILNNMLKLNKIFDPKISSFFQNWRKTSASNGYKTDPIFRLVIDAIIANLKGFEEKIVKSLSKNSLSYKRMPNQKELINMIINIIPPNEIINSKTNKREVSDIVSILNAGWGTYISYFEEFSKNMKMSLPNATKYEIKKRLNEILLKAIELSEIRKISEEQI